MISYKSILQIRTIEDLLVLINSWDKCLPLVTEGMFFIMRDNIFPNWEDPSNRMGGCLSFKISSTNVISEWKNIFLKCILDELLKDNNDKINGLSISPKKEFNIIKIWFSESIEYKNLFIDNKDSEVILSNSLYKKHVIEN